VSREDVRRDALSQRVKAAGADEVIAALEQAGVLREVVDDEEDYPGPGRPARRWQVNPALLAKPAAQIAEKKTSPESKEEGEAPRLPALSAVEGRAEGEVGRSCQTESSRQIDVPPRVPAPVQTDWPK
ncbi:MAG TPA: hypothetical protein VK801_03070, partial [Caulobacteraceae bacterium]|nr:hypothetical protein [Caulobacteraceae bacterium]